MPYASPFSNLRDDRYSVWLTGAGVLRPFGKPLGLLFVGHGVSEELFRLPLVRLGLFEELLGLLFARLRLREELKRLLADVVGLLLVRLGLLQKQEGLLFVRLGLAKGPLRFLLVLPGLAGGGGRFDLVLRCLPGVLRRLFLVSGGALNVCRGAIFYHAHDHRAVEGNGVFTIAHRPVAPAALALETPQSFRIGLGGANGGFVVTLESRSVV